MRLTVLGRLRLRADDDTEVAIPRGKATTLLLLLAGHHGRTVTIDKLMQALWGENPPRTAMAGLHNHVWALRSALGHAQQGGEDRLQRTADGYQLDLLPGECDLIEFEQLVREGRDAARRGDHERVAGALRLAVALWQGQPSSRGTTASPPVADLLRAWEHARITAHEDCLAAEIELGRHDDVVPELHTLLAEHPLREELAGLLMRALWLGGNRAGALEVYTATRSALIDALGVEPGAELRDLQSRILRGERPPEAGATPPPLSEPPRQLPADTADFTGRDDVLSRIVEGLDPEKTDGVVRVVVVSGQPGAGKTTVAIRAAHRLADRFPGGQLYASLGGGSGSPRSPEDVLADLLRGLGVPDAAIPTGAEQRAASYRTRLARRRVLVVLDDAADVGQIRPLLPGTAGASVLVTSRRRLVGPPCVISLPLAPLTREEGVLLLTRVIGRERVETEPEAAGELVDLCGGLPLAIRVVVARLVTRPSWSLARLLAKMRDRRLVLDELAVAELDVRAGFTVSHDALGELERRVFRRFALVGTPDLPPWALAALVDDDDCVDQALHNLLESHLVEPASVRAERYTMHDLVRVFASEQGRALDGDPEIEGTAARAAFRRVFDRCRMLIELAHRDLPPPAGWLAPIGPPPSETFQALPPLPQEMAAAVSRDPAAWCATECETLLDILIRGAELGWYRDALDAAERLSSFLAMKHRRSEIDRVYSAVARASAGDALVPARAEFGRAHAAAMGGQLGDAAAILTSCAEVFTRAGENPALMNTLVLLSFCRMQLGDLAAAEQLARDALDLRTLTEDLRCEARALRQLGNVRISAGDPHSAVSPLRRALAVAERIGEADLEAVVLSSLAKALIALGELDAADDVCRRALTLLDELDQPVGHAYVRLSHSRIVEYRGGHREAIGLIEKALRVFTEFADRRGEVEARHRLAVNLLALGQTDQAAELAGSALALARELGMHRKTEELDRTLAAARAVTTR
ncbi:BTAD domain-containing putative transcriptional regulator [Saccharomonospora xinjiangensis]|uniref:AfsR/SARP family transcriptional regulator n=1 Tax=Saccharomonospora xinjiangensis TaxID=75294 RepID=UPI00106FC037|nr:BTAD domain-containing putative transcriptional regulator [Saccharomonospora xinjiangensis]QBQ59899.1 Regulatory protein AfsR [Saccharomonospora xinjiangensis]